LINLRRSRPRVAKVDLAPAPAAAGSVDSADSADEQERARRRRHVWIPALVLVALIGVAAGYFLFIASDKRAALSPDASAPTVAAGGRFAQRFADLLAASDVAGLTADGPALGANEGGRWDPFAPLVELGPAVKPIESDSRAVAPPEPEPEPPKPPQAMLTGVLRSGGRAVAIIRVEGQTRLTRVGESPFDGAVVRSIDDKSVVVSFLGEDIHYSLGGEQ